MIPESRYAHAVVDAGPSPRRWERAKSLVSRAWGRARGSLRLLAPAALLLWVARVASPVLPSVVVGDSMTPTLHTFQPILIDRWYYNRHSIQRGDVIAFEHQGVVQVKRVYALPRERVAELHEPRMEGVVFVARPERLPQVRALLRLGNDAAQITSVHVPSDAVYVLGDGGPRSRDSRHYGCVPTRAILGRVHVPLPPGVSVTDLFAKSHLYQLLAGDTPRAGAAPWRG